MTCMRLRDATSRSCSMMARRETGRSSSGQAFQTHSARDGGGASEAGLVPAGRSSDRSPSHRGFDAGESHANLLQRSDALHDLPGLVEQLCCRRVKGPHVLV